MPQMIHIVLFKFDSAKLAKEFPGNALQDAIAELRSSVPGLLELNLNAKNATPWEGYGDASRGYTHALTSKHKDIPSLKLYADFPPHKELQKRMGKCFLAPPLRMEVNMTSNL